MNPSPFNAAERAEMEALASRYPERASALLPLLHFVQERRGRLDEEALMFVAGLLGIPHVRAYEVATYYTLFTLEQRGRHLLQVCRNLPCHLAGGEAVREALRNELGIAPGETTPDGAVTLLEVECIGGCGEGPALLADGELVAGLTPEKARELVARLREELP